VVLASEGHECGQIACDHIDINLKDKEALQRGAQIYTNYCAGCHGMQYQRYERTANDIGVPAYLYKSNLIFNDAKIGDLMTIGMQTADAKIWFGAPPPDLSLESRLRGTDWIYTYLRNFYRDDARPWGVNNKVFPNVGMPHALQELQGLQECALGPSVAENGGVKQDPLSNKVIYDVPCGKWDIKQKGSLTPEQYDSAVKDLVTFLAYVGEPSKLDSHRIGVFVLLFLSFMLIWAYLLKREYWKDVH
jgi:ubiquinol-cytochrome c reductase cytochrome b subunit